MFIETKEPLISKDRAVEIKIAIEEHDITVFELIDAIIVLNGVV